MRIKEFYIRGGGGGGVGGSRPDGKKTALTAFFLFVCFLFVLCSPQPINRGVPMVLFQRGSIFSNFFQERGGGGPNVNFYRNPYITCDFLSPPPSGSAHA